MFWMKKNAEPRNSVANIGVEHGKWGEDMAALKLKSEGFEILARNVRPYSRDRRLEIDIIAYEKETGTLVFVEVKQHSKHWEWEGDTRGVDVKKRQNMCKACRAWLRAHPWDGGYRFDVIEVYGVPEGGKPEVRHIKRVNIFETKSRFVPYI